MTAEARAGSTSPTGAPYEEALARLAAHKDAWVRAPMPERLALIARCRDRLAAVAEEWVRAGCAVKGIDPASTLAGEEWLAGPVPVMRNLRLLARAMKAGGTPRAPWLSRRPDGQVVARVFPDAALDRLMLPGVRAEVWMQPGKTASQGAAYRSPPPGRVCLVLGGGNVSSIGPMDVLTKLFVELQVVVLKVHPVQDPLAAHVEVALSPLVEAGLLAVVRGGVEVGAALAGHPLVDTLHVTGSDRTYDAIVWGPPEEQAARKAEGRRANERPFSAELGCVTPVLVVPGPWSAPDMDFQARQVAGMVVQNASFNCNAAKVVVVAKGWPQREAFLGLLEKHLRAAAPRRAYYPGARERWSALVDRYPGAAVLGQDGGGESDVPWTILRDVPPRAGEPALERESFCGVVATTTLDATSPVEFLSRAVPFANDVCWGNLSCAMLVHPTTHEDHEVEVDRAVAELRFGGVAVNAWPALLYALGSTTWGAFPGNPPEDIRSGVGVVHDAMLFDHPQKSVAYAPFRASPKPAWFPDHRSLDRLGRALFAYETRPSLGALGKLALAAMRG